MVKVLFKGGIDVIELILRTEAALGVAELIKKEIPEIVLGFGTVLTIEQVKAVVMLEDILQ